jgi:polyether ionophore transport system permease protein
MVASSTAVLVRPRPWSRVIGLASVFAKSLRDSRRAALVVGILGGLFMLATAAPVAAEFDTPEKRRLLVTSMTALPAVFRGLLGEPINLETLGGFISWRVGNSLPVLLGLWSVLALSGTLAGEAAKGSLDLLVSTPHSRRSIALQKLAGHVTALAVAMLIMAALLYVAGRVFATLPGDEIPLDAALGQVTLYGLLMLASGSIAFAVAPIVGRSRAVGVGLIALFGMYLVSSYSTLSPALETLGPISWYAWTAGHRPIAGVTDWSSVGLLAIVVVALMAIGVAMFERRDLGAVAPLRWLRVPGLPRGTSGSFARLLADLAPGAVAWGAGVGLYAALIASSAQALTDVLNRIPGITEYVRIIYPDIDLSQPSGILQLAFFAFASLMAGLAGATFLAAWASDEGERRLDLVLSTTTSRIGWALRSGLAVMAGIGVFVLVLGLFVIVAVATQAGDIAAPVIGSAILGLAAAGFAGIGFAVGGLVRSSLAAPVAAATVIATFVLDTLGAALDLPDAVLNLSIYKHLGQPMAGTYDVVGIVVAAVLAVGGLLIGAWGLQRRDLGR